MARQIDELRSLDALALQLKPPAFITINMHGRYSIWCRGRAFALARGLTFAQATAWLTPRVKKVRP